MFSLPPPRHIALADSPRAMRAIAVRRRSDKAADNLRFAKILIQLGLDPDNVTYDAIFNRLLEIFLANITIAVCSGRGCFPCRQAADADHGALLRVSNMISNVSFMAFGALPSDIRTFLAFLLLLPITLFASVRCSTSSRRHATPH